MYKRLANVEKSSATSPPEAAAIMSSADVSKLAPPPPQGEHADTVAKAEVLSLKPQARIWEKRSNLFFLSKPEVVLENIEARQTAAEQLKKEQHEE